MYKIIYINLVLLFFTSRASAQYPITGKIVDVNKQPLIGATIKNINNGVTVQSNRNGHFSMSILSDSCILSVSFLGYQTKKMKVLPKLSSTLEITLEEEFNLLNTVEFNTGYEKLSPERSTGSFSVIQNELFNRQAGTDVLARLENTVPGLIFLKGQRSANENLGLNIRGQSTLFSNTDPLIVLDNFPYDGDLAQLNPNDIESITILKDAAAASIWGARAGNGVIVITTKKARYNQKLKMFFNSNIGFAEKPNLYDQDRMSTADYIETERDLFNNKYYQATELNPNRVALSPVIELLIAQRDGKISIEDLDDQLLVLKNNDYRAEIERYIYRVPINQQYAFRMTSGTATTNFQLSLGHDRNLETLLGNSYQRSTLRTNFSQQFLKSLEWSGGLQLSRTIKRNNNAGEASLLSMQSGNSIVYPYLSFVNENGKPLDIVRDYRPQVKSAAEQQGLLNWSYNPLNEIQYADNSNSSFDVLLNTNLKYKVNNSLDINFFYQYGQNNSTNRNHQSIETYYARDQINRLTQYNNGQLERPVPLGGILDLAENRMISNNVRGQLNYNATFGKYHVFSALAGSEIRGVHSIGNSYRLYGYDQEHATSKLVNYTSVFKSYLNPASTSNLILNRDDLSDLTDRYLSYFMNFSYNYKETFVLSASARLDRSNIFGVATNQKGIPLWSIGGSWNIHKLDFLKAETFPILKLRATYGQNGNVNKSLSAYTTAIYTSSNFFTGLPFAKIVNPPNPELRWERVNIINLGIDFVKGKSFNGTIDFFSKKGIDLIGTTPFAPSSGITTFTGNTAATLTQGIDVLLNSINVKGLVSWETAFSFSLSKDKVTDYAVKGTVANYLNADNLTLGIFPLVGRPLYSIYSYPWAGLDNKNGDPMGYLNGAPSTDYSKIIAGSTLDHIIFHGPARPPYYGFLRNSFSYKNFKLSFTLSYRFGYYFRNTSIIYGLDKGLTSAHGDYARRWKQSGDEQVTYIPSLPATANTLRDNFYARSSVLVDRADHIRLQDLNLNYSVPKVGSFLPFHKLSLHVYGSNLGVLWKRTKSKVDPDYRSFFPPVKTINFGINIEL